MIKLLASGDGFNLQPSLFLEGGGETENFNGQNSSPGNQPQFKVT